MTANPTSAWVTQQACDPLIREAQPPRSLIRDREAAFGAPLDAVSAGEGVEVIRTPI